MQLLRQCNFRRSNAPARPIAQPSSKAPRCCVVGDWVDAPYSKSSEEPLHSCPWDLYHATPMLLCRSAQLDLATCPGVHSGGEGTRQCSLVLIHVGGVLPTVLAIRTLSERTHWAASTGGAEPDPGGAAGLFHFACCLPLPLDGYGRSESRRSCAQISRSEPHQPEGGHQR